MNKKITTEVAVGIIVIVALIIGAVVWFGSKSVNNITQTPSQTVAQQKTSVPVANENNQASDWQTYRNDKYGFEFQYPKDWKTEIVADNIAEDCNSGTTACNSIFPEKQKNCGNIEGGLYSCVDDIHFGIIKNEKKLQLKDFLEKEYGWTNESGTIKNNDIQQSKFGSGYAYRLTEISGFDGSEVPSFWVTLNDGNLFNISGSYLDKDEKMIFDQILSSFKFITTNEAVAKVLLEKKNGLNTIKSITSLQSVENYMRGEFDTFPSKEDLDNGRDTGGGGIFLAAKVNSEWKLVFDGNGQIECKIVKQYNFPSNMISDCAN